jgi:hypothetical protein
MGDGLVRIGPIDCCWYGLRGMEGGWYGGRGDCSVDLRGWFWFCMLGLAIYVGA